MTAAQRFHAAIRAAQIWLMGEAPARAPAALRIALGHANRLGAHARNMVMRVMNWVRADMVRAAG